jgi:hypothetical protein
MRGEVMRKILWQGGSFCERSTKNVLAERSTGWVLGGRYMGRSKENTLGGSGQREDVFQSGSLADAIRDVNRENVLCFCPLMLMFSYMPALLYACSLMCLSSYVPALLCACSLRCLLSYVPALLDACSLMCLLSYMSVLLYACSLIRLLSYMPALLYACSLMCLLSYMPALLYACPLMLPFPRFSTPHTRKKGTPSGYTGGAPG